MGNEGIISTKKDQASEQKLRELAGMLHDALDLMKQLASGMVVSGKWIVARDSLIVEARIALTTIEENTPSTTTGGEHEHTATATDPM